MAAHESISEATLGRSSSMDARDTLSRSDSQRKSKGRRVQRSGNDLFVCFAPRTSLNLVSRRVLSPARDNGKEPGRRRGRALSSSIFAKAAKKQGFEGEEPTSPKVTCIGQVREKHKKGKAWGEADALLKGKQRSLESSNSLGSPGRSATKPDRKKEQNSSACSSFGKDFSCFGLPCDSYGSLPSFRGDKKRCGAVFAKSLVLIQETDKLDPKGNREKQLEAQPSCTLEYTEGQLSVARQKESGDSEPRVVRELEEQGVELQIVAEATYTTISNTSILKEREEPSSEAENEDGDTFEPEPRPPNALLLMRRKTEHLRVVVPPPSVNITLKRSASAPAQCRVKSSSKEDEEQFGTDQGSGKENGHTENDEEKPSRESMSVRKRNLSSRSQKSFLKRCKSVSLTLTRSNGTQALASCHHTALVEKEKPDEKQEVQVEHDEKEVHVEHEVNQVDDAQAYAVKNEQGVQDVVDAAGSRKRFESEALKVSLDIVPETWLWETYTIACHEREKTADKRPTTEWLNLELEASLWKNCKVGAEPLKDTESTSDKTDGQWLDGEVEATLWRSCHLAAARSSHRSQPANEEAGDAAQRNAGRNSSIGSQLEQQERECMSIEEGGEEHSGREGDRESSSGRKSDSSREEEIKHSNSEEETGEGEIELGEELQGELDGASSDQQRAERLETYPETLNVQAQKPEDTCEEAPSPAAASNPTSSSADAPLPPSPAPTTATADTLLVLSYNLGAIRMSLDASESLLIDKSLERAEKAQQKAMLKAMSHFHEVGTYARLLKAASGKERGSLSSAFRLQRCKSEPVRL